MNDFLLIKYLFKKKINLFIGEDSIFFGEKGGSIFLLDISYEKVEYVVNK